MDFRIGKQISIIQKKADHFINESLHPFGINKSQMEVLLLLKKKDGRSQAELNEYLLFNKGSVTKLLSSLEALGYIRRCTSSDDKRKNEVYLTPKAAALFPVIINTLTTLESAITKSLSDNEQEIFKELLQKVNDSILNESKVK